MRKDSWGPGDCGLLANVHPLCDAALFAQHVAAPVKSAVAPFAVRLPEDVVSTAAAQGAAAVGAVAGFIADASLRARRVYRHVLLAKVRRLLKVHQLSGHAATTTSVESPRASAGAVSCSLVEDAVVLVLGVDQDG